MLVLAVAALLPALLAFRGETAAPARAPLDVDDASGAALAVPSAAITMPNAMEAAARAVYRYSVVPGGVADAGEMRDVAQRDSVVAAHYAGIRFDAVNARSVMQPRMGYMSYRIGERVYWTRRPVALREGETILDDGNHQIRARCGNLISEEPRTPTLEPEPPTTVFDEIIPDPPAVTPAPVPASDPPQPQPRTSIPRMWTGIPAIGGPSILVPPPGDSLGTGGPPAGGIPFMIVGVPLLGSPTSPAEPPPLQGAPAGTPAGDRPSPRGGSTPGGENNGEPPPHPATNGGHDGPGQPETPNVPDHPYMRIDVREQPDDRPVQVPEPATLLLVGVGGAIAAVRHRRSRS